MAVNNELNKLNILHNTTIKIAKLEKSTQNHLLDVKMVPLQQITRDQLGEILPAQNQQSNSAPVQNDNESVSLNKDEKPRYCAYCGVVCPYNHTYRKYKMNCSTCSRARYLPALYCNICGKKSQNMFINYLDICCNPADSDCLQYSKENPYN